MRVGSAAGSAPSSSSLSGKKQPEDEDDQNRYAMVAILGLMNSGRMPSRDFTHSGVQKPCMPDPLRQHAFSRKEWTGENVPSKRAHPTATPGNNQP